MSIATVTAVVANLLKDAPLELSELHGRETGAVQALVDAARAGDCEAFGALLTMNERSILKAAMAALGDRADAEDAAQDACIVAWQRFGSFRGDATFRTWILTIVWRKALDRRRRRHKWWERHRDQTLPGSGGDRFAQTPTGGPDPERETMSRELARRVAIEIRQLPPKLRDALLLATSGEHSYAEIAAMLRIPLGTVKWRVSEARRVILTRLS
jgi:RNA polymerase sigma-70 factor, ECF subfamily